MKRHRIPPTVVAVGTSIVLAIPTGALADNATSITTSDRVSASAPTPTSAWAVIGNLATSGPDPLGLAVDADDDTVYVSLDLAPRLDVFSGAMTSGTPVSAVALPDAAQFLAVDDDDDTVYATPNQDFADNGTLWRISGSSLTLDDSIATFAPSLQSIVNCNNYRRYLFQPTVDQVDDTVYLGASCSFYGVVAVQGDDTVATLPANQQPGVSVSTAPQGFSTIGLDSGDDSLYAVGWDGNFGADRNVYAFPLNPLASTYSNRSTNFNPGLPFGMVVDSTTSKVYVTDLVSSGRIDRLSGASLAVEATNSTLPAITAPLAAGRVVEDLFTLASSRLLVIDPSTLAIDDSVTLPGNSVVALFGPSTSGNGLVYTPRSTGVAISAKVTSTPGTWSAPAGGTITSSLAIDVASRLAPVVEMDDSTVTTIAFADDTSTSFARVGNQLTITVPPGTGTVPVTAQLNGGNSLNLGTFTYSAAPTPDPAVPSSPPVNVTATPGVASATVSWQAPSTSGSFPITNYQVTSVPSGGSCLVPVPALSCEIEGLTPGEAYTFIVRALTGAGWSAGSTPSNSVVPKPVTPTPTIMITGYRGTDERIGRVFADGVTTHLAGRTIQARVHLAGETDYYDGSTRRVSDDESFTWQRRTKKKVYVYFTTEDRLVRSNRIIITP